MSTPHQHTDLMARIGKGGLVTIIALGLGEAIALGTVIYLIWQMVDHISREPQNALGLLPLIAAFGVAALSIAGLRTLQFSVTERIGLDVVRRLRMVIYGHMSGMAPRQIQHRSRGSLILRLTGDLTMLRTWISRGIGRGIISATVIACGTVLMALFSVKIALSVLAIFAVAPERSPDALPASRSQCARHPARYFHGNGLAGGAGRAGAGCVRGFRWPDVDRCSGGCGHCGALSEHPLP